MSNYLQRWKERAIWSFLEILMVFQLSCTKHSVTGQKRSATLEAQGQCKFTLGNSARSAALGSKHNTGLQKCSAHLPYSEAQHRSTNAQCHCSTSPEAQHQTFFAQNSLKLATSSHFFYSLLANENNEFENEMWELKQEQILIFYLKNHFLMFLALLKTLF